MVRLRYIFIFLLCSILIFTITCARDGPPVGQAAASAGNQAGDELSQPIPHHEKQNSVNGHENQAVTYRDAANEIVTFGKEYKADFQLRFGKYSWNTWRYRLRQKFMPFNLEPATVKDDIRWHSFCLLTRNMIKRKKYWRLSPALIPIIHKPGFCSALRIINWAGKRMPGQRMKSIKVFRLR
jgi:hypothetical protein